MTSEMTDDDSREEDAADRFIREHRESVVDAFQTLEKKIKRNKSLNFYRTAHSPAVTWPFVKTYVGGTNRHSFAILVTLMPGDVSKEERVAQKDEERLVFPICHYFDHQNMMSCIIPTKYVAITKQCIRQICRHLPCEETSEKDVRVGWGLKQLAGTVIYADMWTVLLMGQSKRKNENMRRISFPIPAKNGLLLCNLNDAERFVVDAFVSDESLSAAQREEKEKLQAYMSPFLDSMIQFKNIHTEPSANNPNKGVHFKPLHFLAVMFGRFLHQTFRPEDYLELYGCGGDGDGRLTAQALSDAMKEKNPFTYYPKGAPEMKEMEDLSAAYLAMGEREFLRKTDPALLSFM